MVNIVSPYSVGDQPCPNFRARAEERPCNRRGCQRTLHGCLSCMKDHRLADVQRAGFQAALMRV